MTDVTIGIGGAAGDGLDKTGDTLAKTVSRSGLYVYAYNSYQSIIRGGHIWLRLRLSQEKVASHGDRLNALIVLNQDSLERHAPEVEAGGVLLFNADKLRCNVSLRENVLVVALPVGELTKPLGRIQPVMQNTVALGALLFLLGLDFEVTAGVLHDTFAHKGQAVIEQNLALARTGYEYARERLAPLGCQWKFSGQRRPFITGNEAFALGAVAAGCKFYSAYPMSPMRASFTGRTRSPKSSSNRARPSRSTSGRAVPTWRTSSTTSKPVVRSRWARTRRRRRVCRASKPCLGYSSWSRT